VPYIVDFEYVGDPGDEAVRGVDDELVA